VNSERRQHKCPVAYHGKHNRLKEAHELKHEYACGGRHGHAHAHGGGVGWGGMGWGYWHRASCLIIGTIQKPGNKVSFTFWCWVFGAQTDVTYASPRASFRRRCLSPFEFESNQASCALKRSVLH